MTFVKSGFFTQNHFDQRPKPSPWPRIRGQPWRHRICRNVEILSIETVTDQQLSRLERWLSKLFCSDISIIKSTNHKSVCSRLSDNCKAFVKSGFYTTTLTTKPSPWPRIRGQDWTIQKLPLNVNEFQSLMASRDKDPLGLWDLGKPPAPVPKVGNIRR